MVNEKKIYLTVLDGTRMTQKLATLHERMRVLEAEVRDALVGSDHKREADIQYGHTVEMLQCMTSRLEALLDTLSRAEVVSMPTTDEAVRLGTVVTFTKNGGQMEVEEVVGHLQSDPDKHRIAYDTQLGGILIGKRVGEEFPDMINGAWFVFKIIKIEVANGGK